MKITLPEVEHVADLARLNLTPEDLETLTQQLDAILSYVAKLEELDTRDVEPMTHALSLTNAFREDDIRPPIPRDEALANAPQEEGGTFIVPRII